MTKKEGKVWRGIWICFGRADINQESGGVKGFSPKFRGHRGLNEESTNDVIEGT